MFRWNVTTWHAAITAQSWSPANYRRLYVALRRVRAVLACEGVDACVRMYVRVSVYVRACGNKNIFEF